MTMPDTSSTGPQMAQPGTTQGATDAGGAQSARQQIREVKDQVVDQAKNTLQQARERATSSLGESRTKIAEQIGGVAQAFHRTAEQLRTEHQTPIGNLADTAARQIEQVANYLRNKDPREMRQDLERVARRQPVAVVGGAFALGLVAARFFKSSQSRRDRRASDRGYGSEGHTEYAGSGYAGSGYTGGSGTAATGSMGGGYAGA